MDKIFVYLDNCCFNRPYDDQSSLSIFLETQAKLNIQALVQDNVLSLIWSFILDYENSANPDEIVKEDIIMWRDISSCMIHFETEILANAEKLAAAGFGKKDALHIACARKAKTDFLITVDKGIIRKANLVNDIKIISPIEFISYLEGKNEN